MAEYLRLSGQAADSSLMHRPESKGGLRSIFVRSKSVLGDRTPRNIPHRSSASDQLPKETVFTYHQSLPRSTSVSLRSRATTSSGISLRSSPKASNSSRALTSWDPPPLFQAYPQSILSATLDTSCMSAGSIIKIDSRSQQRRGSTTDHLTDKSISVSNNSATSEVKRGNESVKKHNRKISGSISNSGWTRKRFVLITSGCLLQYSGEGHHDRLPEKILPLSRDSVAFASDAIPGKHWVLQISQDSDQNCLTRKKSSRSGWGRLGFRSMEARRIVESFLLIFDQPEEFDTWMSAVRKEIERLGGLQYRVVSPSHEQQGPALEHRISQRFQVQKNPYQFSSAPIENSQLHLHLEQHPKNPDRSFEVKDLPLAPLLPLSLPTRSTAGSSVHTSTELDALRQSDSSSISATTAFGTSFEETEPLPLPVPSKTLSSTLVPASITQAGLQSLTQPTEASGSPILYLTSGSEEYNHAGRRSPESHVPTSLASEHSLVAHSDSARPLSLTPNFSHPIPNNRVSQGSIKVVSLSQEIPQDIEIEAVRSLNENLTSGAGNQRPLSTLAPLPTIGVLKLPRPWIQLVDSAPPPLLAEPGTPEHQNCRSTYQQTIIPRPRPPSANANYVLFPKRYSSFEYSHVRITAPSPPPQCDLPQLPEGPQRPKKPGPNQSAARPLSAAVQSPASTPSRPLRRPVSMQIRTERLKQCHSLPERSPAVTDAHFATNFGTQTPFSLGRRSETATGPNRSTYHQPRLSTALLSAISPLPPPRIKRLSPKKSKPSVLIGTKTRPPPAGPPPNCPLPAVPMQRTPRSRDILEYQREVLGRRSVSSY